MAAMVSRRHVAGVKSIKQEVRVKLKIALRRIRRKWVGRCRRSCDVKLEKFINSLASTALFGSQRPGAGRCGRGSLREILGIRDDSKFI